jgi:hypothetical protein
VAASQLQLTAGMQKWLEMPFWHIVANGGLGKG